MNSEERDHFQPQKVSVFMEIGVFFSHKISEKGVLFKLENTDGLHVLHWSGGTGEPDAYVQDHLAPENMDVPKYEGKPRYPHSLTSWVRISVLKTRN